MKPLLDLDPDQRQWHSSIDNKQPVSDELACDEGAMHGGFVY